MSETGSWSKVSLFIKIHHQDQVKRV